MDTTRMLHLTDFRAGQNDDLLSQYQELEKLAIYLKDVMEKSVLYNLIVNVMNNYELGTITDIYQIFGGYVNQSFGVYTIQDGKKFEYFVRMYKSGITEKEVRLEHSLIDFSIANGMHIAAGLIRTKENCTFVRMQQGKEGEERFFAVYDFLPGEDKYTWDNPDLNDKEYASVAEVLATFHNTTREFDPRGRERVEPKIMELLPMLPETFRELASSTRDSKFLRYFRAHLEEILEVIATTKIHKAALRKLPLNPIHSDYHPGNLKFLDDQVVGVFDFDWCKIDIRLFDVCLALVYFCASWQDEMDGVLRLEKCQIFLRQYQQTLRTLEGLEPLNDEEIRYIPTMLAAANLYLINWAVTAYYYGTDVNDYEYLAYLKHCIRLLKWLQKHDQETLEMTQGINVAHEDMK